MTLTREDFDLPEGAAYLNCAYLAPQLGVVREAAERVLEARGKPWNTTPDDFFTGAERGRDLFARLVGVDPDGVALVPAASYGIATAARNVEVRRGDAVLVLEEQFPSNYYPWLELCRERGASLTVIERPPDGDWTRAVLEELDENVSVAALPNCHWTDGSLVDLVAVGERVREVGAALVVDATQSVGAMPLDAAEVRPDFLVAAGYKWLLGPYGSGFMYVSERFREGKPIEQGWLSRAGSEDFARLVDYTEGFQPGARRYDSGGRGVSMLLPMANAALDWILARGVREIYEEVGTLTDSIATEARKRGYGVAPEEYRARHMIGLRLGAEAPSDLAATLASDGVYISQRGGSLRVSPHVYNDERDVERLFGVLDLHIG